MNRLILALLAALLLTACSNGAPLPARTPAIAPPTQPNQKMTLDQARQISAFHILEPSYLPSGLNLRQVIRWADTSFTLEYASSSSPGSSVNAEFLTIREDYRPSGALPPGISPPAPTPDYPEERVMIHDDRALVLRNYPPPTWLTPMSGKAEYISLEWHAKDMNFLIAGSQSLDELVRIATSLQ